MNHSDACRLRNAHLEVAIAEFFFACCVIDRIVMAKRFHCMIACDCYVDKSFLYPNRNTLRGPLLKDSFQAREERNFHCVVANTAIYGLGIMPDGAMVSWLPLINIIVSNTADPPSLVKVHDCSKQLANNGTKNAMYIVSVFTPWITRLDLHGNQLDLCLVDRARNIQNADSLWKKCLPGL